MIVVQSSSAIACMDGPGAFAACLSYCDKVMLFGATSGCPSSANVADIEDLSINPSSLCGLTSSKVSTRSKARCNSFAYSASWDPNSSLGDLQRDPVSSVMLI